MAYPRLARLFLMGLTAAAIVASTGAAGQDWQGATGRRKTAEQLVRVRVLADVERVGPGEVFHLACVFDVEPKWHIYWRDPGTGAMPPEVTVTAPEGFRVGAIRWPRPRVMASPIGDEYGYENQVVLFVPVTAPRDLKEGRASLEALITWAVCKDVCLLGRAEHAIELATSGRPTGRSGTPDPLIERHKRRLPKPLAKADGATVEFEGGTLTLTGPAGGCKTGRFFPVEGPGVTYEPPRVAIHGDRFHVDVKVNVNPNNALGQPMTIGGLVALGSKLDDPCYHFELPVPASNSP